jgi:hypothetical protein
MKSLRSDSATCQCCFRSGSSPLYGPSGAAPIDRAPACCERDRPIPVSGVGQSQSQFAFIDAAASIYQGSRFRGQLKGERSHGGPLRPNPRGAARRATRRGRLGTCPGLLLENPKTQLVRPGALERTLTNLGQFTSPESMDCAWTH